MKEAILLYPSPIAGHLVSMVELGKLILTHRPSLSVIILITAAPYETTSNTPFINRISSANPSITFLHLPDVSLPPNTSLKYVDQLYDIPRIQNPNFQTILGTLSQHSSIKSVVLDFFCCSAFEISTSLSIPTYYFYTSGASGLAVLLYFPTIDKTLSKSIKDIDDYVEIPGLPPIYSLDMPEPIIEKDTHTYANFITTGNSLRKCAGLLANTFQAFEPRAFKAVMEGTCNPDGSTPPFYSIGPLVASDDRIGRNEHECLNWLDSQPNRSVVFLCFGSMGLFSKQQLKDMAIGLEKSGHRFLWVVRNPNPPPEPNLAATEPDLDALLPEGFLERTGDKGLVVKSWAPQVDVLNHDSVGGFVTHCGWNSTLEAVMAGVPMLAWPLYAEQRMNRVVLVEELKVALSVKESEKDRFVSSDELEKRVIELMEGEGGNAVRDRVMEMKDAARAAVGEGGSSRVALARFFESIEI